MYPHVEKKIQIKMSQNKSRLFVELMFVRKIAKSDY